MGLTLLKSIILETDLNFQELKSLSTIILVYLPEYSRDLKELKSYKTWNSFARNLTRSNRRTTMYRLALAAQDMGNELPSLEDECDLLIFEIYRLIKGDTGAIKDSIDRQEWVDSLESKPIRLFKVGSTYYKTLKN